MNTSDSPAADGFPPPTKKTELSLRVVVVLDDHALDALAEGLREQEVANCRLASDTFVSALERLREQEAANGRLLHGWLDAKDAAEYLGITLNSLHKKTADRSIPFEQDVPGGKLWFKASDLDDWRRGKR